MATVSQQIQQVYLGLLGRAADQSGLDYWTNEIDSGALTLEQLRANIVNEQPEYAEGLGNMTRAQVVANLYENLFDRAPDSEGLDYWVNGGGSTVNADQLVLALVNGAAASDTLALDNKVEVAQYYTAQAGDDFSIDAAAAAVADVDGSLQSVQDAKADIDSGSVSNGQTFTLTAGIDLPTNTAGDDTFVAVNDGAAAANQRLALGDDVNGGAGVDTLKLVNNQATVAAANLTDIEKVTITQSGTAATNINAANWAGVQEVTSLASSENVAVSNLQNLVTVGFNNTVTNINVGFAAAAVAGSADELSVSLNKAGNSTTTSTLTATAGIEALSIASNGSAKNYLDVTAADGAAKTLTVTGDAALALTIDTNTVTSFDASANQGGVALTGALTGTAAAGLSVKGSAGADSLSVALTNKAVVDAGAGDDVITLSDVANLNATDSVAGGEGNDTLSLASADAKTVAADADRSVITGFETLQLTGAVATADGFDISKFGLNSLKLTGDVNTAATVTGFTSGATVELANAGDQTAELNIGMQNATDAGTDSDTLNVKLNADVTDATVNTADLFDAKLGVDGVNVLNVSTSDSDTTTKGAAEDGYALALSNASNVTEINATGSSALSFTSGTATDALKTFDGSEVTANLTVDLSGFTGTQGVVVNGGSGVNTLTGTGLADQITGGAKADDLVGGAGNDAITAGAGNDNITGGVGADALTGGAGTDTFVFTTAGDSIVTSHDSISDLQLGDGGDVLAFGANAATAADIKSLSAGAQDNVTAAADLAAAVNQVLVETGDDANSVATFTYDGHSYALYNAATATATFDAATDSLVDITGATGTLETANLQIA